MLHKINVWRGMVQKTAWLIYRVKNKMFVNNLKIYNIIIIHTLKYLSVFVVKSYSVLSIQIRIVNNFQNNYLVSWTWFIIIKSSFYKTADQLEKNEIRTSQ